VNWYLKVLKDFADFNSRSRRKEYWMFALVNFGVAFCIGLVAGIAKLPAAVVNIYQLAIIVPSIAVGVRRMHDIGKSGWYFCIPIYNIVLLCEEGVSGPNQFGPDPKGNSTLKTAQTPLINNTFTTQLASANSDANQALAHIEKLAELKAKGHLTQEEFDQKKKQILAS
jgi:uncharacterized membrane protein YhaH (DUF805 family)